MALRYRTLRGVAATALALLLLPLPMRAQGTPTRLLVRAVAHDAKIIGSGVGGARITVKNTRTGEVLASGTQEGGTGNTAAIVGTPRERGATVYDTEGAASWETTLNLTVPTQVEVIAEAPLGNTAAIQRTSKTLLMVPGEDIVGEGLILELNGFAVGISSPDEGPVTKGDGALTVRARVTMMCGCTIEPGGLWDANRIRVVARLVRGTEIVAEAPMSWAGKPSVFEGTLPEQAAGDYELRVLALDPERANMGMATRKLTIR